MEDENSYFKNISPEFRRYLSILAPDFPKSLEHWLEDYIKTPAVQHAKGISMFCGCQFLNFWDLKKDYNILDHSVACAFIVWHFTHDKKQVLSALFHDISNPAFKHCIDVMNGDALTQESTEAPTLSILKNSREITKLLCRDGIKLKEVADYHIYPIADNNTPRLATDRLEYTFMNAHLADDYSVPMPLSLIRRYYNNLCIAENEDGLAEIAFVDYRIAEEFLDTVHHLWHNWLDNRFQLTSETYAKLIKKSIEAGDFAAEDLYHLTDTETAEIFRTSYSKEVRRTWATFSTAKNLRTKNSRPNSKSAQFITPAFPVKVRFIDPLVCTGFRFDFRENNPENKNFSAKFSRLSSISKSAKRHIEKIQHYPVKKFAYLETPKH